MCSRITPRRTQLTWEEVAKRGKNSWMLPVTRQLGERWVSPVRKASSAAEPKQAVAYMQRWARGPCPQEPPPAAARDSPAWTQSSRTASNRVLGCWGSRKPKSLSVTQTKRKPPGGFTINSNSQNRWKNWTTKLGDRPAPGHAESGEQNCRPVRVGAVLD